MFYSRRQLAKLREEQVVQVLGAYFKCEFPMPEQDFMQLIKSAKQQAHPDKGGDMEEFQQLMEITSMLHSWVFLFQSSANSPHCCTDGTLLTELGHGVGPNRNGVACRECDGYGYRTQEVPQTKWCFVCKGAGSVIRTNFKGVQYVRDCYVCNGTGVVDDGVRVKHHKCWACKGVGEKEIFNPVLPKGRIA